MIVIPSNAGLFNYRIAGVALHDGRVLLHTSPGADYWALPGGRAEMMEHAAQTLRREMLEELNVEVTVGELLWVGECFFEIDETRYHEIGLYFAMSLPAESSLLEQTEFHGDDARLSFRWHEIGSLDDVRVKPDFVAPELRSPSTGIVHHVIDELG